MVKALSVAHMEFAARSASLPDFQSTYFMLKVQSNSKTVSERVLDRVLAHVEIGHFSA